MTVLWYATRGTGVVALLLLTATVVLGVAGTARMPAAVWSRLITSQLHRKLSLLVVVFVALHVATTVLDPFAPVGWTAAVVPFSSAYRPLWLGLGAVAFDLLLAVLITSLLRVHLGYRAWRSVHWLGYACWPVAFWHGLGAGTDTRLMPMIVLDVACAAAVAWALWQRARLMAGTGQRAVAAAACAGLIFVTVVFALSGPLRPGWARRAGTPVRLLGGTSQITQAWGGGASLPTAPGTDGHRAAA